MRESKGIVMVLASLLATTAPAVAQDHSPHAAAQDRESAGDDSRHR